MRTRVGDKAIIEDSVVMGSDIYQVRVITTTTNPFVHSYASMCNRPYIYLQRVTNDREGTATSIPIGIGEGSHIRKAIVDKNSRIGKNVMVLNTTCVSTS